MESSNYLLIIGPCLLGIGLACNILSHLHNARDTKRMTTELKELKRASSIKEQNNEAFSDEAITRRRAQYKAAGWKEIEKGFFVKED